MEGEGAGDKAGGNPKVRRVTHHDRIADVIAPAIHAWKQPDNVSLAKTPVEFTSRLAGKKFVTGEAMPALLQKCAERDMVFGGGREWPHRHIRPAGIARSGVA